MATSRCGSGSKGSAARARHQARGTALCLAVLAVLGGAQALGVETRREPAPALRLAIARERLAGLLRSMSRDPDVFPAEPQRQEHVLTPAEREQVVSTWGAFTDLMLELESRADHHARLYRETPRSQTERRAEQFQLHRAAFLASYRFAMDFIERIEHDESLPTVLDEAHPDVGLPAGAYAGLKWQWLHVSRAVQFAAVEVAHAKWGDHRSRRLRAGAAEDRARILELGGGKGPALTLENGMKILEDGAQGLWMPAQEGIARFMGEVRVHRQGESLIARQQIRALQTELEPGDILLERREWYLTNAGIPGFWPHAALYVGTPAERRDFFSGPEVRAWVIGEGEGSGDLEALLRSRDAAIYERSLEAEAGNPRRVLEAIADGVTFTSLEHSAAADSLAVLRPRLSRRDRAIALVRAFYYAGRPYDYDFDFVTDDALVCSELIYKAYQPLGPSPGLELPLESVAGRTMMAPNAIARLFSEEWGRDERQLDFVLMLDGDEGARRSVPADVEAFRASWRRPKWHILTASPADAPPAAPDPAR